MWCSRKWNSLLTERLSDRAEEDKTTEMFDNPLYGLMVKPHSRGKDQDHLPPPDTTFATKPAGGEPDRPPVPTPRSFIGSETKPPPPAPIAQQLATHKKVVMPSRSHGAVANNRPPLPAKSQTPKPTDYRDNSELPSKHRPPARPGQPHKDSKEELTSFHPSLISRRFSIMWRCKLSFQRILTSRSRAAPWSEIRLKLRMVQLPARHWKQPFICIKEIFAHFGEY